MYSSESSKWKAYQFSDPFSAGKFIVCNKINRTFCRPDCDYRQTTNLKSEIKFVDTYHQALAIGFLPCCNCDPLKPPMVDVDLLVKCVEFINHTIGFIPPLIYDDELNDYKIKQNLQDPKRRMSVPNIKNYSKDFSLSKNDSDHFKLVDLACRHLALAAAINLFQLSPSNEAHSPNSNSSSTDKRKRRRRGGVLGFKELAAKSKLSAWHFHRVFKSVTGLTPKTYGDKCWEFLKNASISNVVPISIDNSSDKTDNGSQIKIEKNEKRINSINNGGRIEKKKRHNRAFSAPDIQFFDNSLQLNINDVSSINIDNNNTSNNVEDIIKPSQTQIKNEIDLLMQQELDNPIDIDLPVQIHTSPQLTTNSNFLQNNYPIEDKNYSFNDNSLNSMNLLNSMNNFVYDNSNTATMNNSMIMNNNINYSGNEFDVGFNQFNNNNMNEDFNDNDLFHFGTELMMLNN